MHFVSRESRAGMASLAFAVLCGSVMLINARALGQVVIDMPAPPEAKTHVEDAPQRDVDRSDDDAREDAESQIADEDELTEARPDAQAETGAQSRRAARRPADDLGRLALLRYSHARQYARPHYPWEHYGYQPRGRGVGPWGLGHPTAWYGDFYAVAPAIFVGGRGERLFR